MAFAITGLIAAFDSHNKATKKIPNMYSLHSWIGLSVVIIFILQWILGFIAFLFPRMSDSLRAGYLQHHKYWGITIFTLVCGVALMGITEKAFFSLSGYNVFFLLKICYLADNIKKCYYSSGEYSKLPGEAVLLNMYGSLIVIFAIIVIYLTKQRPKHDYEIPKTSQF